MKSKTPSQQLLFERYVAGTRVKEHVFLAKTVVCKLNAKLYRRLCEEGELENSKVYVSTKVLKHIYDDHFHEHEKLIDNLNIIVNSPEAVYRNKDGKSGAYLLIKDIQAVTYCVVMDVSQTGDGMRMEIRTCFQVSTPKRYLKGCELVWKQDG
jgi:hypothetical protein